jgi:hypothetical protein
MRRGGQHPRNPQVRWSSARSRHDGRPTDTQDDTKNRSPRLFYSKFGNKQTIQNKQTIRRWISRWLWCALLPDSGPSLFSSSTLNTVNGLLYEFHTVHRTLGGLYEDELLTRGITTRVPVRIPQGHSDRYRRSGRRSG